MSYYCKGINCPHKDNCMRVQHLNIPALELTNGCWHVEEKECISNSFMFQVPKIDFLPLYGTLHPGYPSGWDFAPKASTGLSLMHFEQPDSVEVKMRLLDMLRNKPIKTTLDELEKCLYKAFQEGGAQ